MQRIFVKLRQIKKSYFPSSGLESEGERVDIIYDGRVDFETLNLYEKSHYRRYEFARKVIAPRSVCGDFACGTGYGTVMLAEKASRVVGADLNGRVISKVRKRYRKYTNVEFVVANLLNLTYESVFDTIVSFETIEHFTEDNIQKLLNVYHRAHKSNGLFIFSTPYLQERSEQAITMGFHETFYINEDKISSWLKDAGFVIQHFKYQNYQTHEIADQLEHKDFIICVAQRQR